MLFSRMPRRARSAWWARACWSIVRGELGDIVAVGVGLDFEFGSCSDFGSVFVFNINFGLVLLWPMCMLVCDERKLKTVK